MSDTVEMARAAIIFMKASDAMRSISISNTVVGVSAIAVGVDALKEAYEIEAVASWLEGFAFSLRTGEPAPQLIASGETH